jgi:hypothetical protein|tara:strand:- start:205 stop:408 length:204 start_codon:yes stop_codon:yes gene_type:complete
MVRFITEKELRMTKLSGTELVEQLARQSHENKEQFAKVLVSKWPTLAKDIVHMIDAELHSDAESSDE